MSEAHGHDEKGKGHGRSGGHGGGHGGGGGHEGEHEGAPEWLISFADNVLLQMGFFVILLAMNMGPKGGGSGTDPGTNTAQASAVEQPSQFLDAVVAIRDAFNNPVDLNSMDPNDQSLIQHLLERRGRTVTEQFGPLGKDSSMQSLRPTNYFSLCGLVPFDHARSEMTDVGRKNLLEAAKHIRGLRLMVDLRGHSSAAEAAADPDGGMRVSFDRALQVMNELTKVGVDRKQMRIVACGDNDRLRQHAYHETVHAANARVEIVVSEQVVQDMGQSPPASDLEK